MTNKKSMMQRYWAAKKNPKPLSRKAIPHDGPIIWTVDRLDQLCDEFEYFLNSTDFPFLNEFEVNYVRYPVHIKRLVKEHRHKRLYELLVRQQMMQENFLIKEGLRRSHDSSLTKFLLNCLHDMHEKNVVSCTAIVSELEIDPEEIDRAQQYADNSQAEI